MDKTMRIYGKTAEVYGDGMNLSALDASGKVLQTLELSKPRVTRQTVADFARQTGAASVRSFRSFRFRVKATGKMTMLLRRVTIVATYSTVGDKLTSERSTERLS
jgi:hypothetical protein